MNTKEKVKFWLKSAERSLKIAYELFRLKRYLEALFFGHLTLEKLLKAKIIAETKEEPVYSHDLLVLAKDAKVKLTDDEKDFLAKVNVYNIRTRYQDYKLSLYKKANKNFTQNELDKIGQFFAKYKNYEFKRNSKNC